MKKLFLILCSSIALTRCTNNQKDQSPVSVDTTPDSATVSFFPVTAFIKGQIITLDSLPVTILQISTASGKVDSSWITIEKLKPLLKPFIVDLIDKENLAPFFKESKFNDQSTDAITFTYDPKKALSDSIALRHWDVYVDPEKGTIKRVYIVKQLKENGKLFTQQLTWQTGKWAKIVTIGNEAAAIQSEVKWVWNGFTD
ncbi:MAG: hypothetical protein IPP72_03410 [Chitinophagaceae bacterium]|nr:hypothetical protein [Chitinophagaceae bacterium]